MCQCCHGNVLSPPKAFRAVPKSFVKSLHGLTSHSLGHFHLHGLYTLVTLSCHPRSTFFSYLFAFLSCNFHSLSLFHVLLPRCLAALVRSTACFNRSLGDFRSVMVARFRRTCAAASAMMAREKIPESMPWLRHPHTPSATPNACGKRRCKKELKGWEKERKKELDSDVSTRHTNKTSTHQHDKCNIP